MNQRLEDINKCSTSSDQLLASKRLPTLIEDKMEVRVYQITLEIIKVAKYDQILHMTQYSNHLHLTCTMTITCHLCEVN